MSDLQVPRVSLKFKIAVCQSTRVKAADTRAVSCAPVGGAVWGFNLSSTASFATC